MGMARQVSSILLVFGLLGLVLWKFRHGGMASLGAALWRKSPGPKSLESLERLPLSPQHSLHLVRIEGRVVLLATYPQGCSLLTEVVKGAST
jgi:flagellar biogenesis protein FliO